MEAAAAGLGLLVLFALAEAPLRRRDAADVGGERRPARGAALPLLALAAVLLLAGVELARNDHGLATVVFPVAFVAAPVLVIFGGAAAGARRFYGWPDLGPTPGRLAAVAAALLLGVLVGTRVREADVEASMARGRALAATLAARRAATGAWPARLEDVGAPPTTRLGWVAPPPFAWDPSTGRLSFPVSARTRFELDAGTPGAPWAQVPPPAGAGPR